MKKQSFKEFVNSINDSSYPYKFLVQNTEEFKKMEKEADLNNDPDKNDIETQKSLLQYLLYANAANQ